MSSHSSVSSSDSSSLWIKRVLLTAHFRNKKQFQHLCWTDLVGTQPTGLPLAGTLPSVRPSTHCNTRMLSPKPGHSRPPLSPRRNQFTMKIPGGLLNCSAAH